MAAQGMTNPAQSDTEAQSGTENQDEIDQIMSEIEQLQKEMNQVTPKPTGGAPGANASEAKTANKPNLSVVPTPSESDVQEQEPDLGLSAAPESSETEEEGILKEFSGHGDEPWLEETLAQLKTDPEENTGKGLLNEASPETSEEELVSHAKQKAQTPDELAIEQEIQQAIAAGQTEDEEAIEAEMAEEIEELETLEESSLDDSDSSSASSEPGSLSMTLQGKMTLQLNYPTGGQSIRLKFSPSTIQIQFADGTELKIPVRSKK
jgi:hypothetical protein